MSLSLNDLYFCGHQSPVCEGTDLSEKTVDYLIDHMMVYSYTAFVESAAALIQRESRGRTRVWANEIRLHVHDGLFYVKKHHGRRSSDSQESALDVAKLRRWVQRRGCEIQGLYLGILGSESDHEGHSNALVLNHVHRTVEHFEPHGTYYRGSGYEDADVRSSVEKLVEQLLPNYKYLTPDQVWPDMGFNRTPRGLVGTQTIMEQLDNGDALPSGSCAVWSTWFLYVRCKRPHTRVQECLRAMMDLITGPNAADGLHCGTFIRRFAAQLVAKLRPRLFRRWEGMCRDAVAADHENRAVAIVHPSKASMDRRLTRLLKLGQYKSCTSGPGKVCVETGSGKRMGCTVDDDFEDFGEGTPDPGAAEFVVYGDEHVEESRYARELLDAHYADYLYVDSLWRHASVAKKWHNDDAPVIFYKGRRVTNGINGLLGILHQE